MRIPAGVALPDFMNLGVAHTAPQGATKYAPIAAFVPPFTLGTPFTRVNRPSNPLVVGFYTLPMAGLVQGFIFTSPYTNPQLPDPYSV